MHFNLISAKLNALHVIVDLFSQYNFYVYFSFSKHLMSCLISGGLKY